MNELGNGNSTAILINDLWGIREVHLLFDNVPFSFLFTTPSFWASLSQWWISEWMWTGRGTLIAAPTAFQEIRGRGIEEGGKEGVDRRSRVVAARISMWERNRGLSRVRPTDVEGFEGHMQGLLVGVGGDTGLSSLCSGLWRVIWPCVSTLCYPPSWTCL